MSDSLTAAVKQKARWLGMDLVGVGNIERWAGCPPMMSPAGLLPTARSVVVCALHHGDGVVELGGEKHPQAIGPYASQYYMNAHLDCVSFEIGRFLEDAGFPSIPVTVSNIWRYREYKELKAVFSPDMSHIYAAVAAGLAELGYSGLALTPQYGPRQRFVSIVTEAALTPDPLLPGNTLCDRCGLCVKKCPAGALDKELGPDVTIEIEGRKYTRAGKNLWRCSWGEHFDLDLDLPIPEKVDEQVLLDNLIRHGVRGGEMGQCLKHCLPPKIREWERKHTSSPRRVRARVKDGTPLAPDQERDLMDGLWTDGVDGVAVRGAEECKASGLDLKALQPNACRLVVLGAKFPAVPSRVEGLKTPNFMGELQYILGMRAFLLARRLEDLGYDAAPFPGLRVPEVKAMAAGLLGFEPDVGAFLITSAPLALGAPTAPRPRKRGDAGPPPGPAETARWAKEAALGAGADVVGVSSAARIDSLVPALETLFAGETVFDARNRATRHQPYDPEVAASHKKVLRCGDYVPGAKSVVVLGVRLPKATVRRACLPPAEAVGPYAFAHTIAHRTLQRAAVSLLRALRERGHAAAAAYDLTGTASLMGTPRGLQPDAFCNRFEAVCAGLATIGWGGFPITKRFGPNVRFLAIVTDAVLAEDDWADLAGLRATCETGCRKCLEACPVRAHRTGAALRAGAAAGGDGRGQGGVELLFHPVEQVRCDWAKRFALVPGEGFHCLGSRVDVPPPARITPESLTEALRHTDPFLGPFASAAEPCILACPYAGHDAPA